MIGFSIDFGSFVSSNICTQFKIQILLNIIAKIEATKNKNII